MGFWIFMLIMDLLIPGIMIGFGSYFAENAPENINLLFGYRTPRSMKNRNTWEFAHHYFGKLWRVTGWILFPVSIAVMLLCLGKDISFIGAYGTAVCGIQTVLLLIPVFITEHALKQNFDEAGRRKHGTQV